MSVDLLKTMADLPADLKLQCLRLLKAKPEVEDELTVMYELDSVAGVKVVLAQHGFTPAESAINVYGGTANLYFGCTFGGGGASKTSSTSAKKGSKKDPSWMVSDNLFLHDVWVSKVFKPLKDAAMKFTVLNGVTMGNNATERLLGGDLKSFGKVHKAEVPNSVHTSKVLHGRGPEGFLELAPQVLKKAHNEGLITELPLPSTPTTVAPPPASSSSSAVTAQNTPAATPPAATGGLAGINLNNISFHGNTDNN